MKKIRKFSGWFLVLGLCILALYIDLNLHNCRFLAMCVIGVAAVVTCYLLLHILKKRYPKTGAVLIWLFSCALGLFILSAGITGILIVNAQQGNQNSDCDYVIVLGCSVRGLTPSSSLQNRIDAAYEYLAAHPETVCIVSGGKGTGEYISEAKCMYQVLTARGISPSRVWMESHAGSTLENFTFSMEVIRERTRTTPDTIGIVSSEYHLFRSQKIAENMGIQAVCIPAKSTSFPEYLSSFLREIFVTWYYGLRGFI